MWWQVALGTGLGALVLLVVYWIARGASEQVAREQAEALQEQERARREALEKAADAERLARAKELDAQARAVRDADDAARLVREQLSRRRTR